MRYNLSLLSHYLKEHTTLRMIGRETDELIIDKVSLLTAEEVWDPFTVYVGEWKLIRTMDTLPEYLICIGGSEPAAAYLAALNVCTILITETRPLMDIYGIILEIVHCFFMREKRMMKCILYEELPDKIMEVVAEYYDRPIVLLDTGFMPVNTLKKASFPLPSDDWWTLLQNAKLHADCISPLEAFYLHQSDSFLAVSRDGISFLCGSVYSDSGKRIYTVIIWDVPETIHSFACTMMDHLLTILRPCLQNAAEYLDNNHFPTLYRYLLPGLPAAEEPLLCHAPANWQKMSTEIKRKGWSLNACYQVAVAYFPQSCISIDQSLWISRLLKQTFPQMGCFSTADNRLYLILPSSFQNRGAVSASLSAAASHTGMSMLLGLPFTGLAQAAEQFRLLEDCMNYISIPSGRCIEYRNAAAAHITHITGAALGHSVVCHPYIHMLHKKDPTGKHNYIQTLYTYLLMERSIRDTANVLHLHRNTLIHRLQSLPEGLPDLNEDMTRFHLLASCYLMLKQREI